ncbi:aldo/keto reductase [Lentisphaerota bacterium WC36G]|nr:aldo/keto reductase [Lentisphaerae bacterium WC36]
MDYIASSDRYKNMKYKRCGKSGLKLPAISLGLWHNFGSVDDFDNATKMATTAFDTGITHFDLANNYGPIPGSAESNFGKILKQQFKHYRDELIISSKAGYTMWEGPYGDWGSRKYLISSCDQSLKRLNLDYVDIFYHHRYDPETPLEESMNALASIVQAGKALYVGISNYPVHAAIEAFKILKELKTPAVLHQVRYNMLNRMHEEEGTFKLLDEYGVGGIVFSPLAQGLLSDRYLTGIPNDSRMTRNHFLKEEVLTDELLNQINKLNIFAKKRDMSLVNLAIKWLLARQGVTSTLIGASSPEQIKNIVEGLNKPKLTPEDMISLDKILS